MKKLVLAAAITAIASSVLAADYSVKPKVTSGDFRKFGKNAKFIV